jgi:hypothetical protein
MIIATDEKPVHVSIDLVSFRGDYPRLLVSQERGEQEESEKNTEHDEKHRS